MLGCAGASKHKAIWTSLEKRDGRLTSETINVSWSLQGDLEFCSNGLKLPHWQQISMPWVRCLEASPPGHAWRMQFISGGLPNWNWYYLALLGNGLLGHWFLFLVGGWLFWALLAGEEVLKGVRLFHPFFFSRLAQPGDETILFCGGFWVGLFCVLFGFVVLVLFLISNCLIPFSSHKSCGGFFFSVTPLAQGRVV